MLFRSISPLVVCYRYLKVQNGEPFFYQQLLLLTPCRSEGELLGNHTSYRERYLSLHPDFQNSIQNSANVITNENRYSLQYQFNTIIANILEDLMDNITPQIADILTKQLDALKLTFQSFHKTQCLIYQKSNIFYITQ